MEALEGIKVLDFGQAFAVPQGMELLADLGADVIKVEPLWGDFTRISAGGADSIPFLTFNRGKRSLAVNLTDPRGIEVVLKLVKEADVLAENFRPGAIERMGLGYEVVSRINPRIIYCSLYMYGQTGPLAHMRGGDPYAQAMSGFVASVGSPEGPPQMTGHAFMDTTAGLLITLGAMFALFVRERTGVGQKITSNLLNTGVFMQGAAIADYLIDGRLYKKWGRGRDARFPYGAYPAKDGDVFTIHGADNDEWATVCSILGIEYLLRDPRYDTIDKRAEHKFELYPILDEAFRKKAREEWQQIFREHKLRCEPCLDYAELIAHPQFQANDMLVTVDHPRDGQLMMPGNPLEVEVKGKRLVSTKSPPILGEHSREILMEVGYSEEEIEKLHNDGVIGIPTPDMFQPKPRMPAAGLTFHWYTKEGKVKKE